MNEAQRLFTARAAPLCPSQLTSPVLHAVLAHPPIQHLLYGGKGVGSQVEAWLQHEDIAQYPILYYSLHRVQP